MKFTAALLCLGLVHAHRRGRRASSSSSLTSSSSSGVDTRMEEQLFSKLDTFRTVLKKGLTLETIDPEPPQAVHRLPNPVVWDPVSCSQTALKEISEKELVFEDGRDGNKVYRIRFKGSSVDYAWKLFGNSQDYAQEVAFYMQVAGSPFCRPMCVMRPGKRVGRMWGGLVMSWFGGKDVLSVDDWAAGGSVTDAQMLEMSRRVFHAVATIHSFGFVHADLKPKNILIHRKTGEVRVIDFGFTAPQHAVKKRRGNDRIVAPEIAEFGPGKIGFAADWWALGASMATIWSRHVAPPHLKKGRSYYPFTISRFAEGWQISRPPTWLPANICAFIYHCCHPDPARRTFNTQVSLNKLYRLLH